MTAEKPAKASARSAQEATRRRSRLLFVGGGAVVLVALAVVIIVVTSSGGGSGTAAPGSSSPPVTTAAGSDTPPPWAAPADASGAVRAAGLPMLSAEGTVEHIHVHLDVQADGQPVVVPALIGIDEDQGSISPVHTHDTSGVIHVESPVKRDFTLGQFFTEWAVALTADNIGGLRSGGGKSLHVFVNGKARTGDPAAITLNAHDEIVLSYGTATGAVPASYDFPAGE
jgi:hypothetical protein